MGIREVLKNPDVFLPYRYLRATILHLASDYEDVFPEDRPKLLENTREALRQFDGWLNGGKPLVFLFVLFIYAEAATHVIFSVFLFRLTAAECNSKSRRPTIIARYRSLYYKTSQHLLENAFVITKCGGY